MTRSVRTAPDSSKTPSASVSRSRMNRSSTPFLSPATRFEAIERNRTWRPSRLTASNELTPFASVPSVGDAQAHRGNGLRLRRSTARPTMAARGRRTRSGSMQRDSWDRRGGRRPAYCMPARASRQGVASRLVPAAQISPPAFQYIARSTTSCASGAVSMLSTSTPKRGIAEAGVRRASARSSGCSAAGRRW